MNDRSVFNAARIVPAPAQTAGTMNVQLNRPTTCHFSVPVQTTGTMNNNIKFKGELPVSAPAQTAGTMNGSHPD